MNRAFRLYAAMPIRAIAGFNATVYDYTRLDPAFFNALQFERTAMRLILSIVVAIAAMNIISGLVMLVKNKSRDIAILRTMGATRASIMRVFLIVGASIGMAGTFAGLMLGILFLPTLLRLYLFLKSRIKNTCLKI